MEHVRVCGVCVAKVSLFVEEASCFTQIIIGFA